MSKFTGPLIIEELVPGRRWLLHENIQYEAGAEGSGRVIVVPAGFETDGATLPAPLRLVLAVWGTYGRAACLHDLGYSLLRAGIPHQYMPTRRAVDAEFFTAMRACGTSAWLTWAMWAAVRVFGGIALRHQPAAKGV